MRKISEQSYYYYYGREWESWERLCAGFTWQIPERMNAAFYFCDAHARDEGRIAPFHEDAAGRTKTLTFADLRRTTNRLANYFKSRGLCEGDRVAICLSQRPETIVSHIAAWKIGAVSVPLTVIFGPDSLDTSSSILMRSS